MRNRGRTVIGTPGWVYVADLARMQGVSRFAAYRTMRAVCAACAPKDAHLHGSWPKKRWRVRTEVLAAYLNSKRQSADTRIDELSARVADLEDELRERDERLDALVRDLQEVRDTLQIRRARAR